MLIVFGGLPGVGKSTLARLLACEIGATLLRIDTIEQAIRDAGHTPVGPAGYLVGYALAGANLANGQTVVADSVNPLTITREAWRRAADQAGSARIEVEVTCSDAVEHQRRIEARVADVRGLSLPSWADVQSRAYEPWSGARIVLDTAGRNADQSLAELRHRMGGDGFEPPALSV